MKKVNVNVAVAEAMNESVKTKGAKVANANNSMKVVPTKKEMKQTFVSYIVSKEQISVSKFFRLLQAWKAESTNAYNDFISAYNLNLNENYSFEWFVANCPKTEDNSFAHWVKVNEKVVANKNEKYNRKTEKGVVYTLVPYITLKADYMQFMQMFLHVVNEIKRLQREKVAKEKAEAKAKAKAEAEKKQHEKNLKAVNEIFAEIEKLAKDYNVPFATAISIYESVKKASYSNELKQMLLAKAEETKTK